MNENFFQGNYKRLNDYDLNILNDKTLKETDDESLRLEILIHEKEEALEKINEKIKGRELLGKLLDVMELKLQAKQIENELKELKEEFAKNNFKMRLKTQKKSKAKKRIPILIRIQRFISRKIFAKISKKFRSIADLGDSLDTLESINENVDELIAMKVPYGETKANYEKLTAYLYRANRIHSEIAKKMNKVQKFK